MGLPYIIQLTSKN